MKVLITGGAGMVGSHTAEYYAKRDNKVVVLDNLMRSELFGSDKKTVEYNWNYLCRYKNIKCIKGDVRNKRDILKAIGDGVDVIVHAAGQPGVGFSINNPQEDYDINGSGTFNLLECIRKRSPEVCFIYSSTNKVYGENVSKIPLVEEEVRYRFNGVNGISEDMSTDLTGHTPYGVSKLVGDLYTQEYAHIYGMRTAVFRMSCIYGIRQFGFEDQGWVAWFVIANLLGRPVTIYGDGKQVRDLLYVTDLIKAFDKFIHSDLKYAVFNIGGGTTNTASLLEFLSKIEKLTGKETKVSFSNWRPSDQKVYISDISKIKKLLDWQPEVGLEEGIERLIEWVRENKRIF